MFTAGALACVLALLTCACERAGGTAAKAPAISWRQAGSWSGRGNLQTESFTSDSGGFRVRCETRNESPAGTGRLKVVFHSGDSGREIMHAVDVRGTGSGVTEVGDRPRWYFLTIDSANVDWKVIVEEPVQP
jgi:hypothetical protein